MLETPKTEAPNMGKMPLDVQMDNQQATLRIVGLYLGEGHFILTKRLRKNGKWDINAEVGFTNSDAALIDLVCEFLEEHNIAHHIGKTKETCYQVRVCRHKDIKNLLDIFIPFMHGNKSAEARLLYRYVLKAIAKREVLVPSIPGSGKLAGLDRWRKQCEFDAED